MAAISDKDFFNQIKNGSFGNLYLVYGEENYQKSLYMKKFRDRVAGGNETFNRSVIKGQDFNLRILSEELMRLPVFSEKRIVEVIDPIASKIGDKDFKELDALLCDIPETTVLVFFYQTEELLTKEKNSDKKLFSAVGKHGFTVEFSLKDEAWLIKYVISELGKEKIEIDYHVAEYIVKNSNGEIAFVKNEIEKLSHYATDSKVTLETAETVCAKSVDASRYDLAKYITERNAAAALSEIDRLFFMRVKPTVILSAIYSAFFDIYLVMSASVTKKGNSDILADFRSYKNREFVLNKARRSSSFYDKKDVESILSMIITAESELKGGKTGAKLIIEELAVKIMRFGKR